MVMWPPKVSTTVLPVPQKSSSSFTKGPNLSCCTPGLPAPAAGSATTAVASAKATAIGARKPRGIRPRMGHLQMRSVAASEHGLLGRDGSAIPDGAGSALDGTGRPLDDRPERRLHERTCG